MVTVSEDFEEIFHEVDVVFLVESIGDVLVGVPGGEDGFEEIEPEVAERCEVVFEGPDNTVETGLESVSRHVVELLEVEFDESANELEEHLTDLRV